MNWEDSEESAAENLQHHDIMFRSWNGGPGGSLSNLDQPAMVMIALDPRFLSIEGVKIAINRHSGDGSIAESLEPCEAVDAWKKIFESCSKLLNILIKTRHLRI